MPLPMIEKMPLNDVAISAKQRKHLSLFFSDIAKRQCGTGNIHDMMLEAYILGFYHCMKITTEINKLEVDINKEVK